MPNTRSDMKEAGTVHCTMRKRKPRKLIYVKLLFFQGYPTSMEGRSELATAFTCLLITGIFYLVLYCTIFKNPVNLTGKKKLPGGGNAFHSVNYIHD